MPAKSDFSSPFIFPKKLSTDHFHILINLTLNSIMKIEIQTKAVKHHFVIWCNFEKIVHFYLDAVAINLLLKPKRRAAFTFKCVGSLGWPRSPSEFCLLNNYIFPWVCIHEKCSAFREIGFFEKENNDVLAVEGRGSFIKTLKCYITVHLPENPVCVCSTFLFIRGNLGIKGCETFDFWVYQEQMF